MSDIAIQVENLGKMYRIGGQQARYKRFTETLMDTMVAPLRRLRSLGQPVPSDETIWALKGVSFEIKQGEVVGIIGRNGAGKSTLLKILSRITEPTEGEARVYGRVGSLLEVGTGFHPELTGRENIYLNGAILGMRKAEIDRKFDEIVAFAEIEKFIDTPAKRYSSGMYVRLAFAVAAQLEPEVLVVDEVLAVGDIEFQKKCLGKMEGIAEGGRTVLLVSHNMATISTLCKQAILLVEGQVDCIGPAQQTVSTYLTRFSADIGFNREWGFEESPGGKVIRLKGIKVTDCQGSGKPYFSTTEPICITIDYWILCNDVSVNMAFWLFDEQGNCICSVGNFQETKLKPIAKSGLYRSMCTIPGHLLNSGKYTITVELIKNLLELEKQIPQCVAFETVDDHRIHSAYSKWVGIIKPEFEWESNRLNGVE